MSEKTKNIVNIGIVPVKFQESLKEIAGMIEGLVEVSIIKHLGGGFSDTAPLLVYAKYESSKSFQVFKVGNKGNIEKEATNWKKFIENGHYFIPYTVALKGESPYMGVEHSLLIMEYAGTADDTPETLEDYYELLSNPELVINHLFAEVLKLNSDCIYRKKGYPVFSDSLNIEPKDKALITEAIEKFLGVGRFDKRSSLTVSGLTFFNPLGYYPFNTQSEARAEAYSEPLGIIHGDLNPKNVLFYKVRSLTEEGAEEGTKVDIVESKIPCIIDYPNMEVNSLFTDIAWLESRLKFQVLRVESINPDELFRFEHDNILNDISPSAIDKVTDHQLQRLYRSIKVLRDYASKIIERGYDEIGYWLILYKNALKHLKYKDLNEQQKRYAFFSASVILTKHLMNRVFEPPKASPETICFDISVSKPEALVPSAINDIIKAYGVHLRDRWSTDRKNDFPKDAIFIDPLMKIEVKNDKKSSPNSAGLLQPESDTRDEQDTEDEQQAKETTYRPITINNLVRDSRPFVISADSGLGKTTLLRELECRISKASDEGGPVPIYFHLRDLAGVHSSEELITRIADRLPINTLVGKHIRAVRELLSQKRFVFLFDGLDQIEDISGIPGLIGSGGFLSSYRVIIAGRPYVCSTLGTYLKRFERLELETFTPKMAKRYLGHSVYEKLKKLLNDAGMRTPMVLSILKEFDSEALEGLGKTSIYALMVDRLITRETAIEALKNSSLCDKKEFLNLFSKLSYGLLDRGHAGRFPWEVIDTEILPKLGISIGDFTRLTHLGIVSEVIEGEALPDSEFIFRHQSFQEYFASLELKKRLFTPEGEIVEDELLKHFEYYRWNEVFIFLIGHLEEKSFEKVFLVLLSLDCYFAITLLAVYKGFTNINYKIVLIAFYKAIKEQDHTIDLRSALIEQAGCDTLEKLTELLRGKDTSHISTALEIMNSLNLDLYIETLLELLENDDATVREIAVDLLGKLGTPKAEGSLISLLEDEVIEVRRSAVTALGEVGSSDAAGHLINLLRDEDVAIRWRVVNALAKIGTVQLVDSLLELLKDDSVDSQLPTSALARIGSDYALKSLLSLLKTKNKVVLKSSCKALGALGSVQATKPLIELLEHDDPKVVNAAASALGSIGSESSVAALVKLLDNRVGHWIQKIACVPMALAEIRSEKSVDSLIDLIFDSSLLSQMTKEIPIEHNGKEKREVMVSIDAALARIGAILALGKIGTYKAVDCLIKLLDDKIFGQWAISALGEAGTKDAVNVLIGLLQNPRTEVASVTIRALGVTGSEKAIPSLEKLINQDDDINSGALAEALGKIGSDAVIEPLAKLLDIDNTDVHRSATLALARVGSHRAIAPLIGLLENAEEEHQWEVLMALGQLSSNLTNKDLYTLAEKLKSDGRRHALSHIQHVNGRRFIYLA